jgi:hypothetical protein
MFRGLREVLVAKLQRNVITKLDQDLFKDATMLITLTLSNNKIAEIQPSGLPVQSKQMDFAMGANPSSCFYGVSLITGTVRVFEQDFALEDAIGSHACSLEALACV